MASRAVLGHALLGLLAAILPAIAMWGFTVDDALITIRYAHDVATGAGYRFDPSGPSTDGVTPLPWTFLLALVARSDDALATLTAAKLLGVVAWGTAGSLLGAHLGHLVRDRGVALPRWSAPLGLGVMALAFPIGAWAASGMETGLATALATIAATKTHRPRYAALLAGLAASLRPEMVVWAVALSVGAALTERAGERARAARAAALAGAIAAAPFVLCALARLIAFGRVAPLALLAKPSDLSHGAVYACAGAVVVLLPLLAFAPASIARVGGAPTAIAVAFVAHLLAVVAAGGDWMPYARLVVPAAPSLVVVFVVSTGIAKRPLVLVRAALVVALGVRLAISAAPAGRHVEADRRDLVARARPVLAGSRVVAAIDIGWVSAATNARIVDLAGLTDPTVAALPGGHTSKRVDLAMLLDRDVDTVLAYEDARGEVRVAEARILRSAIFDDRFQRVASLPLGSGGARYLVFRRR